MPAPEQNSDKPLGWVVLGIVAFAGIAAAISSGDDSVPTDTSANQVLEGAGTNEIAAEQRAVPIPLDKSAVQRGQAQLKMVARLALADATKIFSQNCYDALAKKFDWSQLDRCGSFDALARRWMESSFIASDQELSWFHSETAATRYLTAATANGLLPGDADVRWAEIELSSTKQALPQAATTQTAENIPPDSLPDADDVSATEQENAAELDVEDRLD